jgi:AraC-like DNA-binding protein
MDLSRVCPAFELVSFLHPINAPGVRPHGVAVNNDLHLIHTVAGKGMADIGGKSFVLRPDAVFFIEPGAEYSVDVDPVAGLEMFNFHFHLMLDAGTPMLASTVLPSRFVPDKLRRIQKSLRQWHRRWEAGSPVERAVVVGQLHQLAVQYLQCFGAISKRSTCDPDMDKLAARLRELAGSAFDAEALAAELHLSVSQMNRRFRAVYGTSPKDSWLKQRYALARARLSYSSDSLAAVAAQLGFIDINYFSRWFTQRSGLPPGRFRTVVRRQTPL